MGTSACGSIVASARERLRGPLGRERVPRHRSPVARLPTRSVRRGPRAARSARPSAPQVAAGQGAERDLPAVAGLAVPREIAAAGAGPAPPAAAVAGSARRCSRAAGELRHSPQARQRATAGELAGRTGVPGARSGAGRARPTATPPAPPARRRTPRPGGGGPAATGARRERSPPAASSTGADGANLMRPSARSGGGLGEGRLGRLGHLVSRSQPSFSSLMCWMAIGVGVGVEIGQRLILRDPAAKTL